MVQDRPDAASLDREGVFGASVERGFSAGIALLAAAEGAVSPMARVFLDCPDWPAVAEVGARLQKARAALGWPPLPVSFVAAPKPGRRRGQPVAALESLYDGRITLEQVVPTRPRCWHDFLNALVWATFPRSKVVLHARQLAMLRERWPAPPHFLPNGRTREQDAVALVDEGGVLLVCAPEHVGQALAALGAKDDPPLAALMADGVVAPRLFGHALYEHQVAHPGRAVRGYPVLMELPSSEPSGRLTELVDERLAAWLGERQRFSEPHGLRGVLIGAAR